MQSAKGAAAGVTTSTKMVDSKKASIKEETTWTRKKGKPFFFEKMG